MRLVSPRSEWPCWEWPWWRKKADMTYLGRGQTECDCLHSSSPRSPMKEQEVPTPLTIFCRTGTSQSEGQGMDGHRRQPWPELTQEYKVQINKRDGKGVPQMTWADPLYPTRPVHSWASQIVTLFLLRLSRVHYQVLHNNVICFRIAWDIENSWVLSFYVLITNE